MDRIAGIFVPVIIGIALVAFAAWMLFDPENGFSHGLLALVTGCFWQFAGLFQAAGVVAEVGEWPSVGLLLNGFKVSLIPVMYGMMIYALSLVIRLVQKPRI